MIHPAKVVSIHPYFRVQPGRQAEARAFLDQMVAKTQAETANLYYDFTVREDVIFCREAYAGAEGLLVHVGNISALLGEFLKVADILRVEVHGAQEELEKLRGPLAGLNPEWFDFVCGVSR